MSFWSLNKAGQLDALLKVSERKWIESGEVVSIGKPWFNNVSLYKHLWLVQLKTSDINSESL